MLYVPGFDPEAKLEVWWTGEGARWSETRSVRWQAVFAGPTGQWAIPLESLPHWSQPGFDGIVGAPHPPGDGLPRACGSDATFVSFGTHGVRGTISPILVKKGEETEPESNGQE
jgi:hypothetical protein